MSKTIQQNKIKVKATLYIIYSIIVVLFIALLSIFFNSNSTHAESLSYHVSVEESLNVTVKPSNVSIDLNPETKQFGIANLDVSVGTNYINGYKLYINSTSAANPTFTMGAGNGAVKITGRATTFDDAYGTTGTKYMMPLWIKPYLMQLVVGSIITAELGLETVIRRVGGGAVTLIQVMMMGLQHVIR